MRRESGSGWGERGKGGTREGQGREGEDEVCILPTFATSSAQAASVYLATAVGSASSEEAKMRGITPVALTWKGDMTGSEDDMTGDMTGGSDLEGEVGLSRKAACVVPTARRRVSNMTDDMTGEDDMTGNRTGEDEGLAT